MNERENKEDIVNSITMRWMPRPNTNTAEALNTMNNIMFTSAAGDSGLRDNIAIVITDGRSVDRLVT